MRLLIFLGFAAAQLTGQPTIGTTGAAPMAFPAGAPVVVTVTAVITAEALVPDSPNLQRLDSAGRVTAVLGTLRDDGQNGDTVAGDKTFTIRVTLNEALPGTVTLRVSASFRGMLNRVFSAPINLAVTGTAPTKVTILTPANLSYLNTSSTTVTGTVDTPGATVKVNEVAAPVTGGRFTATVPLVEGPNILAATATTATGASTASIQVYLDTTPPRVTITSPPDGFVTTEPTVTVAGNVNDIVVGTVNPEQASVTVNGAAAQVANRTFLAPSVALALGENLISAVGRDRAGNSFTTQIRIRREAPSQPRIRLVSGNNQTGVIGTLLPAPLVVAVVNAAGQPVANKPVIFKVTQNNGALAGATPASAMVNTNAAGQAQIRFTLGQRAGAGGNTVEAYAVGYDGTAIFTATGTQGRAGKIVIDTGNNQVGAVNQPLPKPLIAVVVDEGNNRLANVPVTFAVKEGGGSFNGQPSFTVNTDSDGRAAAILTLGLQEGNGNNLVEANFALNQGYPASFTASGRAAGDPAETAISGVVLDNTNLPIAGVTVRAVLTNSLSMNSSIVSAVASVRTDAQGQFTIKPAPVGFVKLLVQGDTAARPGKYPNLDYDLVTVAGRPNTVGGPIFLLPLKEDNQLCVTATTGGGTLTIPEAPGFSLTFAPNQVTFPGNTKTGCVSVTVVHADKVPMTPGFGQQPRFIVTIQPAGAVFNPPAAITLPNVDGLKPRSVTEMYSFDHDIGSFVAIGTGAVSEDGQVIRSHPGVGVLKAGWHCGGNPEVRGTIANCPACQWCQGATWESATCIPDPAQILSDCRPSGKSCQIGTCGSDSSLGFLRPTGLCLNLTATSCADTACAGSSCGTRELSSFDPTGRTLKICKFCASGECKWGEFGPRALCNLLPYYENARCVLNDIFFEFLGRPPVITWENNGKHSGQSPPILGCEDRIGRSEATCRPVSRSWHYCSRAIDIRSKDLCDSLQDELVIVSRFRFGERFIAPQRARFLIESRDEGNEHFHIQFPQDDEVTCRWHPPSGISRPYKAGEAGSSCRWVKVGDSCGTVDATHACFNDPRDLPAQRGYFSLLCSPVTF